MSEPQSSGALAVEMAGLDVIPESDRKGKPSDLFMPWFAANISVLGISWGSWVLGFGLSLAQAVVVSVVGVALSFVVCGLIAIAGKRGSAPTLVLSRAAFGFNGNRISAAISWILTVGWETFLAIMAVQATATVMGALGFTNHVVAQIIALILVVVLAAGSGILGFEAIMKVQTWITWATAVLTLVYLVLVAPTIDFAVLASRPSAPLTAVLGAGCMLLVGFGFGWINAAADYSRYLPRAASTKGVVGWTTVGAALPTVILVFFGILLVGSADESLSEAIGNDPIGALTTLGVVIAAWGGVMLADIALRRKDYDEPSLFVSDGRYGSVNWGAVATLAVASFVGWGLVVNTNASWLSWQGYLLGPLGGREGDWAGANIGILLALVVGFAGYWATSAGRVRAQEAQPSRTYAQGAPEGER